MVSGAVGSLVTIRALDTDISGPHQSTLYLDQNPARHRAVHGRRPSLGPVRHLHRLAGEQRAITDPTLIAVPNNFLAHRFRYFAGPNTPAAAAAGLEAQTKSPIQTTVTG